MNNTIYTTKNYDLFELRNNNRSIDYKHAEEIAESMLELGYFGSPIVVSKNKNKYVIQDGQHRYWACKQTGVPIKYIIVEQMKLKDIAKANSLSKSWKQHDYIQAFQTNDDGSTNYNYKRLNNLFDKYKDTICSTTIFMLAGANESGKESNYQNIKNGYFRLNDEMYNEAIKNLEKMLPISIQLKKLGYNQKKYSNVIGNLVSNKIIDSERMAKQIENHNEVMYKCANMKQSIEMFDMVYNYRSRNPHHFRDAIRV